MHDHEEEHVHEHTHIDENGNVYTHSHGHTHDGEHTHHHEADATPKEELVAMLKYMVGHNASHVQETKNLAEQLRGDYPAVYEKIAAAVSLFEQGNAGLADALADLTK